MLTIRVNAIIGMVLCACSWAVAQDYTAVNVSFVLCPNQQHQIPLADIIVNDSFTGNPSLTTLITVDGNPVVDFLEVDFGSQQQVITYTGCRTSNGTTCAGSSSTATITVTPVSLTCDQPVAFQKVFQEVQTTGNVVTAAPPASQTLVYNGTGSFSYTINPSSAPPTGFTQVTGGSSTVSLTQQQYWNGLTTSNTYAITESQCGLQCGVPLAISVTAVNTPPEVNDDEFLCTPTTGFQEGDTIEIAIADLLANDNDDADTDLSGCDEQGTNGLNPATFTIVPGSFNASVFTPVINGSVVQINYVNASVAACFNGVLTFDYSVADFGCPLPALTGSATVTVHVCAVNTPPNVNDDVASVNESNTYIISIASLIANDDDLCDSQYAPGNQANNGINISTFTIQSTQLGFSAVVQGSSVVVTPTDPCFNGSFSFVYQVSDFGFPDVQSGTATVNVTVNAIGNPPNVNNVSIMGCQFLEGGPISIPIADLIANDDDFCDINYVQNQPANNGINASTFSIVQMAPGFNHVIQGGNLIITPVDPCFNGNVEFVYQVSDFGFPNVQSAAATVVVEVCAVNSPPNIANDALSGSAYCEGAPIVIPFSAILSNDDDACDTAYNYGATGAFNGINPASLTVSGASFSQAVTGLSVNQANQTISFTLNNASYFGPLTFEYTVCDLGFPLPALCGSATVTVTITSVNSPPVISGYTPGGSIPQAFVTALNSPLLVGGNEVIQSASLNVYSVATITDPENNASFLSNASSTCGSVTITQNGTVLNFTPAPALGCAVCEVQFFVCDNAGPTVCDPNPVNCSGPYIWQVHVYDDRDNDNVLTCCSLPSGFNSSLLPSGFGLCDNCPDDANPSQSDNDGDGIGDACDNCQSGNQLAFNPNNTPNPAQSYIGGAANLPTGDTTAPECHDDTDGDGIGDCCDQCVGQNGGIMGCTDPLACNFNPFAACDNAQTSLCDYFVSTSAVQALNFSEQFICVTSNQPNHSINMNTWLQDVYANASVTFNFSPSQVANAAWTVNGVSLNSGLLFPNANNLYTNCSQGCQMTVTISSGPPPTYVSNCATCPSPSNLCTSQTTLTFTLHLHKPVTPVSSPVLSYGLCSGQQTLQMIPINIDAPYLTYQWSAGAGFVNAINPPTSIAPDLVLAGDPSSMPIGSSTTLTYTVNGSVCGSYSTPVTITVNSTSSIAATNPSLVDSQLLYCPSLDEALVFTVATAGGSQWQTTPQGLGTQTGNLFSVQISDLPPGGQVVSFILPEQNGCPQADTLVTLVAIPQPLFTPATTDLNVCSNAPENTVNVAASNIDFSWITAPGAGLLNGVLAFETVGANSLSISYTNVLPGSEAVTLVALDPNPGTQYGCAAVNLTVNLITHQEPSYTASVDAFYCQTDVIEFPESGLLNGANTLTTLTGFVLAEPTSIPASISLQGVTTFNQGILSLELLKTHCNSVNYTYDVAVAPNPNPGAMTQQSFYPGGLNQFLTELCANSPGAQLSFNPSALPGGPQPEVSYLWSADPTNVLELTSTGSNSLNLVVTNPNFSGSINVDATETWQFEDNPDYQCSAVVPSVVTLTPGNACTACELIVLPGMYLACADFGATFQWGYFIDGNPEMVQVIQGATESWFEPNPSNPNHAPDNMFVVINPAECPCISLATLPTSVATRPDIKFADLFTLYPNPTSSVLNLRLDERLAGLHFRLELFNTLGQLVLAEDWSGSHVKTFNTGQLAGGMYTASLKCLNYPWAGQSRIIIQH